ncbi:sensor histidine kinase [Streptococcus plurextorum]|uniref:sensor histidine kinase n=1 Tax=Streptococcus plurextorum TaxID=456876 RepID=UPI00040B8B81|nr:GHKL domain-containing protein [Streptococcus plurextorum]
MVYFSPIEDIIFFLDMLIRLMIFEQISGLELSVKKKFIISFILTIILYILFGGRFYYLLEPLALIMVIPFFKTKWNMMQRIFYGLLPMIIGDMFQRIIGLYIRFLLDISISDFNNSILFSLILTLLLIPFYTYFFKGLRIESKYLQVDTEDRELSPIFWGLNILFITYFVLIRGNLILEIAIESGLININWDTYFIRTNILLIYFVLFTIGLLYLNYIEKDKKDRELQDLKDRQVADLSQYSNHVESLYREIRSFRHDYTNILVSLSEAIENEDISLIRSIYNSVIADSDKKFYKGKYDIARLSNLQNPAMKSLLSAKMIEAQQKGIDISVEIDDVIDTPDMELIDFITMISILMDNAIEAAERCQDASIIFAYFQDQQRKILLIENTTLEEKVNIDVIYQYGYSSKGDNRGIGLANVKNIVNKYPKISLSTNSHQYRFSQEFIFIE